MGQRPRSRPQYLAAKLLAIRKKLGVSQPKMAKLLELNVSYSRICEYEKGVREPNLSVLLSYATIAGVHMEVLVNDELKLPD